MKEGGVDDVNGVERSRCPICGGELEVNELYQYSLDYKITKSGKVSKRYTKHDSGWEATIVTCADCGENWGVGDFDINSEGRFIDYKYAAL